MSFMLKVFFFIGISFVVAVSCKITLNSFCIFVKNVVFFSIFVIINILMFLVWCWGVRLILFMCWGRILEMIFGIGVKLVRGNVWNLLLVYFCYYFFRYFVWFVRMYFIFLDSEVLFYLKRLLVFLYVIYLVFYVLG